MRQLLAATSERAISYLEQLENRAVAPSEAAVQRLAEFDIPFPEHPVSPELTLRQLDEAGSPATMAMAGPRFFGFVIGGTLPAALAASWLATAWDQNSALYNVTPATAVIEQVALRWLLDVLRLPADSGGAFVTGTTVAHFSALSAARHALLAKEGWNVEADGLFGAPPLQVIVSEEAHPTLLKALAMLGLGRNRVVKIPVDGNGAMRLDRLPPLTSRSIVCVQAGNVNTGAFDPAGAVCERARDAEAWVHVDGAFGLWASAAPSLAQLARGIELADSWATDCHKWLNVPYDCGVAFVRDQHALRAAMAITAEYLPTASAHRNPADFTPELSRRARGVEVWAALHSLGRTGLADMIERTCRHARRFADALRAAGCKILNEVVLNQVLVSFGDAETTMRIIDDIQKDGTCWCGGTVWQGHTAMRISVVSWATTDSDVERSIDAIVRIACSHQAIRAIRAGL
jgi:glutamate/tyrosine decarboxylase-like PLP-dependent enzyme